LNRTSETNLRRYLGDAHNLKEFLYLSQSQAQKSSALISTKPHGLCTWHTHG
ncbi:unnamed protein product, partial [Rotaria sp. Silwood2]